MTKVPSDIVSSRIEILGGTLSTTKIVKAPGSTVPIVWSFEPPKPSTYVQALSEEVSLQGNLATSKMRIVRTNRKTGDSQGLDLTQVNGSIEVEIINLEPESVVGVGERTRQSRVEEFRWFYLLSPNRDRPPYPIPVGDSSLGGNPYCPMSKSQAL